MRPQDKIEKYLSRLVKKYNGSMTESEHSRYYKFGTKILRVSDHISKNSKCAFAIILSSAPGDQPYIIHCFENRVLSSVNYNQLKEFVRSFIQIGGFCCLANTKSGSLKVNTLTTDTKVLNDKILNQRATIKTLEDRIKKLSVTAVEANNEDIVSKRQLKKYTTEISKLKTEVLHYHTIYDSLVAKFKLALDFIKKPNDNMVLGVPLDILTPDHQRKILGLINSYNSKVRIPKHDREEITTKFPGDITDEVNNLFTDSSEQTLNTAV